MVFKPMPVTMVELRLHISETSHDISEELGLVSYAGGAMLQVVSECPPGGPITINLETYPIFSQQKSEVFSLIRIW